MQINHQMQYILCVLCVCIYVHRMCENLFVKWPLKLAFVIKIL